MNLLTFAVIFFMGLALIIVLMLPLILGIPYYKFLLAKLRRSMIILMLNPSKRLEVKEATSHSSIIATKKGNYHFLNTPDAIYSMFGIPTAIAYHKYGAILPPQNIIHATEMRNFGFKNIGEVEDALVSIHDLLYGTSNEKGLLHEYDELKERAPTFLFELTPAIEDELKKLKITKILAGEFKLNGTPLSYRAKIAEIDGGWSILTKKSKYKIISEDDKLNVYSVQMVKDDPKLNSRLEEIEAQIQEAQEYQQALEQVKIEKSGIIRIQDIFNFLNKNLSTDVIFSIIERNVAEEMRGIRDHFGKFQQMLPTILTLIIIFVIAYLAITGGGAGGGLSGIGESITGAIPNIGAP